MSAAQRTSEQVFDELLSMAGTLGTTVSHHRLLGLRRIIKPDQFLIEVFDLTRGDANKKTIFLCDDPHKLTKQDFVGTLDFYFYLLEMRNQSDAAAMVTT